MYVQVTRSKPLTFKTSYLDTHFYSINTFNVLFQVPLKFVSGNLADFVHVGIF